MSLRVTLLTVLAAAGAYAQSSAAAGTLTVTSPASLVVCQPAAITVGGGTAPYYISILPGGQSTAAALQQLPTQDAAGSVTWNVNIAAGTSITIQVRDGSGSINYSSELTIQSGSDTSCLSSTASSGASTSASGSTSMSGSTTPMTTGASTGASTSSGTGTTKASSTASSTASHTESSGAAAYGYELSKPVAALAGVAAAVAALA